MACKFLQQWSWVAYQRRTAITVYLLTLFHSSIQHTTQKGKTNLDFTEARDSEWQWHQLGHKQVCISIQTDNHASTPPLNFLQAGCPFCHQSTAWKHWRHVIYTTYNYIQIQLEQKNTDLPGKSRLCEIQRNAVWASDFEDPIMQQSEQYNKSRCY